MTPVVDAHARIGEGREVALTAADLVATMDRLGIGTTLISPGERCIAVDNREGNLQTTSAAAVSGGRLLAYAVATPWRGPAAVDELARAADSGAVALAVDSVLQGFDLLDGLLDPLLEFARDRGWFVYVRTGTPPSAVPLPLALLALRYPELDFVMGRSGATDFWIDAAPALRQAPNLYADTAYAPWDTVLSEFARDPEIGTSRVVFSTDAPYTVPAAELRRVRDWTIGEPERAAVLGGTVTGLLGGSTGRG
ncbi:amidohydrolase family protein [Amycolatopsis magusensis]|uniref:TIM-barrel fold metal-dependent hydrolase n=1 Tax=Amycolatopsis magusensis TaxID=882444 RepID=A0ABS4Q2F5_9PSEU|nr:amidohydrolase family protein [Amycolatopsis magusensis]MBP2185258.1 putative TIM-barrel fold metal-dependent hydrolase [Amycolatopsis magusensis]MDI5980636.1 amidohydrolase family protein [Amycolatopsis magusensis]